MTLQDMRNKEDRAFRNYITELSKKELQDLCRTYGLSPYNTKPNLVNSLISYYKVLNTDILQEHSIRNSTFLSSETRGTSGPGYVHQHDENVFKHQVEVPHIISFEKSNLGSVTEIELSDMSQSQPSNSDSLAKDVVASAGKSTRVPSFEFSVRSDEGINVIVDLNSTPSDWLNKLEDGICLCHSFWKGKLQSFCEEHKNLENSDTLNNQSFLLGRDLGSNMKSGPACSGCSPNTVDKDGDAVVLYPAADNASLGLSKTKPCTVPPDVPTKENVGNKKVSDPTTSQMDGEAEKTDRNNLQLHEVKQDCRYKKPMLFVDFTKTAMKHQNVPLSAKSTGNTCSLEIPSLVSRCSPVIGAMEIQSSEMICQDHIELVSPLPDNHDKSKADSVPRVKSRCDGPTNLSEVNHKNFIGTKPTTSAEEKETIGSGKQKKVSDKVGRKSVSDVSDKGRKRKRQDIESEKDHGSPDGRNLRSSKRTRGQVHRRSKRLVSK